MDPVPVMSNKVGDTCTWILESSMRICHRIWISSSVLLQFAGFKSISRDWAGHCRNTHYLFLQPFLYWFGCIVEILVYGHLLTSWQRQPGSMLKYGRFITSSKQPQCIPDTLHFTENIKCSSLHSDLNRWFVSIQEDFIVILTYILTILYVADAAYSNLTCLQMMC